MGEWVGGWIGDAQTSSLFSATTQRMHLVESSNG